MSLPRKVVAAERFLLSAFTHLPPAIDSLPRGFRLPGFSSLGISPPWGKRGLYSGTPSEQKRNTSAREALPLPHTTSRTHSFRIFPLVRKHGSYPAIPLYKKRSAPAIETLHSPHTPPPTVEATTMYNRHGHTGTTVYKRKTFL